MRERENQTKDAKPELVARWPGVHGLTRSTPDHYPLSLSQAQGRDTKDNDIELSNS